MKLVTDISPVRTNGVTVVINKTMMMTQPPIMSDNDFLHTMMKWCMDFQKGHNSA